MKTYSYSGRERDDTVVHCAGCGRALHSPTAEPDDPVLSDPEERLVVLATCRTVVEANMLKLRLESAGIDASAGRQGSQFAAAASFMTSVAA